MLALYSVGFLLYYSVGLRQTPLSGSITNCPALFLCVLFNINQAGHNCLYTYDRKSKFEAETIRKIISRKAAIED